MPRPASPMTKHDLPHSFLGVLPAILEQAYLRRAPREGHAPRRGFRRGAVARAGVARLFEFVWMPVDHRDASPAGRILRVPLAGLPPFYEIGSESKGETRQMMLPSLAAARPARVRAGAGPFLLRDALSIEFALQVCAIVQCLYLVKSPEPFHEHPSAAPRLRRVEPSVPAPVHREHSAAAEEREFEPRYLELPSRRGRYRGRRNLILGVVIIVLCVPFFGWALYLGGPVAAMTLVSCLATATALYVAARLRLFRQRNGGFLALAIVCVVAVGVALSQQAWLAVARPGHGAELAAAPSNASAAAPVPGPSANTPPSLVEALGIPPPDPARGRRAKVLKDSRVEIDGQQVSYPCRRRLSARRGKQWRSHLPGRFAADRLAAGPRRSPPANEEIRRLLRGLSGVGIAAARC